MEGVCLFFFFKATATTEIYSLSLRDARPISGGPAGERTAKHSIRASKASISGGRGPPAGENPGSWWPEALTTYLPVGRLWLRWRDMVLGVVFTAQDPREYHVPQHLGGACQGADR